MSSLSDPTRQDWFRLEAALDRLLEVEPHRRTDLLDELCADEPTLRAQLVDLLAATEKTDFLERPLSRTAEELLSELERDLDTRNSPGQAGDRVGPYELLEIVGRGGMGVVYLAERADRQFEKRVAVKLMPRGMESAEIERRFLAERQILATLEHPGIARLLDGQVTDDGHPYLVMEYVEGRPIDEYCRDEGLGLDERLELFLAVCDAVQYAHQNLVIHRDIKPSNILVTAEGQVKLLDFGIAKLLDPAAESTAQTLFQPLTPRYASPEQIANRQVSTVSDVYSLGVLLYELLTGEPPYRLDGLSAAEAESAVGLEEPAPPSSAAARANDADAPPEPSRWRLRLRGDLDNIVLKALAKEPDRRYATAERLADDIRRYLVGLPVRARPRTWRYTASKFVARHRLGVAAALLVLTSIAVGLGGIIWQGRRAAAEAERAKRTAAVLAGLFEEVDPYGEEGRNMSVAELLDRSVDRVREELADDAATRTELLDLLGRAYHGQGRFDEAVEVHREALRDRRRVFGEDSLEAARSMTWLADSMRLRGDDPEEVRDLWRRALAIFRREQGADSEEAATVLQLMGIEASGNARYDEAERYSREALRIARATDDEPTDFVASTMSNLSVVLGATGRRAEGTELLEEALVIADRTLGPEHPFTATMRSNLAIDYQTQGDYERAEELYREAARILERALGADRPSLADTLTSLGRLLMDKGDFAGAEEPIRRAAEIRREHSVEDNFYRLAAEINLATLETELGRPERAEPIYRSALERFLGLFGNDHLATARVRCLLASCLRRSGELAEAESQAREALRVYRALPVQPQRLAEALLVLGEVLQDRGQTAEAEPLLREAIALIDEHLPPGNWLRAVAEAELAAALDLAGDEAEATRLLAKALPVLEARLPPDDPRLVAARALPSPP